MLFLAIVPSIILFVIIWHCDKIEKEPPQLLGKLFCFGFLTIISAMFIEWLGGDVIFGSFDKSSLIYQFIENFLIVAVAEEGGKYLVLKKVTWKHPAFNYTFDAVVYSVTVSLGFATPENILYLLDGELSTAITRALFSVPGHVIYAIYMGYYYGLAKHAEAYNDMRLRDRNLKKAFIIPVLLHGFYDFCLSPDHVLLLLSFLVFEVVITILATRQIMRLSNVHAEIPGTQDQQVAQVQPVAQNPPGQQQLPRDEG